MNKLCKKNPPRAKIIPDSLFYSLWTLASGSDDYESFLSSVLSQPPKGFKHFIAEYKVSSALIMTVLKNIFELSQLSIKNIIDESGKKKAELRDIFCIPIRTLEDWYYEKNKCPSYVRLMMLRHFRLLNLGDYIHLESEIEHERLRPRVYDKHEINIKDFLSTDISSTKEPVCAKNNNTMFNNNDSYHSFQTERNDDERQMFLDNKTKYEQNVSKCTDELITSLMKNNPRFFH